MKCNSCEKDAHPCYSGRCEDCFAIGQTSIFRGIKFHQIVKSKQGLDGFLFGRDRVRRGRERISDE